jgi:1-Cys peroxiredoxin 6
MPMHPFIKLHAVASAMCMRSRSTQCAYCIAVCRHNQCAPVWCQAQITSAFLFSNFALNHTICMSFHAGIRLGNVVPEFACETTQGHWYSFHDWKKGKWAILFSHPADFTPVCTTEIGQLALKQDELAAMGCMVATLSVDPVKSHNEWLDDVVAHCEKKITVKFPIISDADRSISTAYGMIDAGTSGDQRVPLTIRAVFIINPENKLMLSLNYPASVGRNMDEIVRCVKALQLSYEKSIATPANWPNNHESILLEDGTRTDAFKGSVFLLPTVSEAEAKKRYPGYHTCDVPSKIPYLRLVKQEQVS